MKSTFKSKINKFLKFLGFNVVKAKRARKRIGVKPYTPEELRNCPLTHPANLVKTPDPDLGNDGRTLFYGDSCPGGHYNDKDACVREAPKQPSSDNNVTGTSS